MINGSTSTNSLGEDVIMDFGDETVEEEEEE
jgi:hypothetical protein